MSAAQNNDRVTSVCGVKVLTWGTSADGGRGILQSFDTAFFGGNVGHAAVEVTFPNNVQGKELMQYCKTHNIPCKEESIITRNENGQEIFREDVIRVYWSWWPKLKSDPNNPHALQQTIEEDLRQEWKGVNFDWDLEKLERLGLKPEQRRHAGFLGGRVMTYGPRQMVHERDLTEEQKIFLETKRIVKAMSMEDDSFRILMKKFDKMNKDLKKSKVVNFGVTEKLILNKYVPGWEKVILNPNKVSQKELDALTVFVNASFRKTKDTKDLEMFGPHLSIVNALKGHLNDNHFMMSKNFEGNLYTYFGVYGNELVQASINERRKLSEIIDKFISSSAELKKVHLDILMKLQEKYKNELEKTGEWNSELVTLVKGLTIPLKDEHFKLALNLAKKLSAIIEDKEKSLTEEERAKPKDLMKIVSKETIKSAFDSCELKVKNLMESNSNVAKSIRAQNLQKAIEILKDYKETKNKIIIDNYLSVVLDDLKPFLGEWKDIVGQSKEISPEQLERIYTNAVATFEKVKGDIIPFRYDLARVIEIYDPEQNVFFALENSMEYLTEGAPPSNVVLLPISPVGNNSVGVENGLDVKSMLEKMVELTDSNAEEFDLYRNNCSKTTDAILEAGSTTENQKKFFRNHAFGFMGNPQKTYQHALAFQHAFYTQKPKQADNRSNVETQEAPELQIELKQEADLKSLIQLLTIEIEASPKEAITKMNEALKKDPEKIIIFNKKSSEKIDKYMKRHPGEKQEFEMLMMEQAKHIDKVVKDFQKKKNSPSKPQS